jgi:protein-S-isoprenylcysteine O-methyltransferase Ste14
MTPVLVWVPTFALFGVLIALGILDWGILAIPNWVRFGIGLPFILIGNIVVWSEVSHFGISQTGGARGILRTSGMYRYSRNPQYVADIMIICGWIVLSSAPAAAMVGAPAIAALIAAPFAEESWLRKQYGAEFVSYTTQVRRFL